MSSCFCGWVWRKSEHCFVPGLLLCCQPVEALVKVWLSQWGGILEKLYKGRNKSEPVEQRGILKEKGVQPNPIVREWEEKIILDQRLSYESIFCFHIKKKYATHVNCGIFLIAVQLPNCNFYVLWRSWRDRFKLIPNAQAPRFSFLYQVLIKGQSSSLEGTDLTQYKWARAGNHLALCVIAV